ncbi:hypothetical protein LJR153_000956 [Paenibacillus sp. LjRoot153]|uniref:hypothetical protein n=1 Tax=Paenibacillus sp. LjRoot153 TaxID=3342270 RepID=UPI003ED06992
MTIGSQNDIDAHGIPGNRKIELFNSSLMRLCRYTNNTMMKVISSLKQGVKMNEIGRIIEIEARKGGFAAQHEHTIINPSS